MKKELAVVLTFSLFIISACSNDIANNRETTTSGETKNTVNPDISEPNQSIASGALIPDQTSETTTETPNGIKPVKTVKKYVNDELKLTTGYDIEGHEVKVIYHYDLDEYRLAGSWDGSEYDDNGNLIKFTWYNPDDSVFRYHEYEYDAAGNMIKDIYHYDNHTKVSEYTNDEAGNKTSEKIFIDGTLKSWDDFEWDSHGNQIKGVVRYPDGTILMTNTYDNEYDNSGNLIRCTAYLYNEYNPDGMIASRFEYEYNTGGLCTKKLGYDGAGNLCSHEDWEYNDKGEVIKNIKYSFFSSDKGNKETMLEYEYDSRGYKTISIRTEYNPDESIKETSTVNFRYEITYF